MKICKNKRSNQYFIYIEKTGDEEALLVTSEAQVKSLKLNLFSDVEEQEETYLLQNEIITEAQVKKFHEYRKDRYDELIENFEQLSLYEQEERLKKLQKMFSGNSEM